METTAELTAAEAGLAFNQARPKSAASWGAIFAGGLVAISTSLILAALGAGLGFAALSPWADHGMGAGSFTIAAAIWLIVMQWISASLGGYIAGRLRTRWIGTHPHERFFRDTATGLVTWSLATVVVAIVFASSVSSVVSGTTHTVGSLTGGLAAVGSAPSSTGSSSAMNYGIDKLFRTGNMGAMSGGAAMTGSPSMSGQAMTGSSPSMSGWSTNGRDNRMEVTRILVNAVASGSMPDADRTYLVSLVSAQTGLSQAEAQHRVDELIASANDAEAKLKAEADAARKGAAETAIYTALALLIGAFIASVSAALGGRLRDEQV